MMLRAAYQRTIDLLKANAWYFSGADTLKYRKVMQEYYDLKKWQLLDTEATEHE